MASGSPGAPAHRCTTPPGPPGFETLIALISTEREVPLKSERGSVEGQTGDAARPGGCGAGAALCALAGRRDLVADVDRPTHGRGRAGVVESARQTDLEVGIEERERVPVGPLDRVVDLPALVQGRRIVGLLAPGERACSARCRCGREYASAPKPAGELAGVGDPAATRSVRPQLRSNSPGRPITTSKVDVDFGAVLAPERDRPARGDCW